MKRRLFICADRNFPRGDAGANRILFMGKALVEKQWDVIVVSTGRTYEKDFCLEDQTYYIEGVEYWNLRVSANKIIRKINRILFDTKRVVQILKKYEITSNDRVLIYTGNYFWGSGISNFCRKQNIPVAFDVVEWHQAFQFKNGNDDIEYKLYKKLFDQIFREAGNIIAISRTLEEHFRELNCNTIRIPIYANSDNVKENFEVTKQHSDTLNLIYPGNPYRKDDLLSMLQGIKRFYEEVSSKVKFHLTGVSKELLYSCIPENPTILTELLSKGVVVIHGWMEYDELIKLYDTIDFVLIARPINIVTKSNFPSKIPELMLHRIPAITTCVGDIAEYLTNGADSIVYDGEGEESCYLGIKEAWKVKESGMLKDMKNSAFKSACTTFNYHQCGELLSNYFKDMV